MKTICINFNIHKPYILKKYRFFDIGTDNFYFDDFAQETEIQTVADLCYNPAADLFLSLINRFNGKFKIAITASGSVLKQLEKYRPETIEKFQKLAQTGCVEFVATDFDHSLASLADIDEFIEHVNDHVLLISRLFDQKPTIFQNTELIYSDKIAETIYKMKFKGVITEGCGRSFDLRGCGFVYYSAVAPKLKILPRNEFAGTLMENGLKDNNLFSPLFFVDKLRERDENDDVINIRINSETLNPATFNNRDVLIFFKNLTEKLIGSGMYKFSTPSQVIKEYQPVGPFKATDPVSGMNNDHDMQPWTGNELQREAFEKLYSLKSNIHIIDNDVLKSIWRKLQCSDYLYFMSTDFFSSPESAYKKNPYKSPYDAFINFMNIIGDFRRRVNEAVENNETDNMTDEQLKDIIKFYDGEIALVKNSLAQRKTKSKGRKK